MAKYTPITKTLVKAIPTVRAADNFVTAWEIEVEYSYAGNGSDLPEWTTTYSERAEIATPEKAATAYTKAELIAMMPSVIEDHIFEAHYEAFNLPAEEPTEAADSEFDLTNLPD